MADILKNLEDTAQFEGHQIPFYEGDVILKMKSGFENYTKFCFIKSDSTVPLVVIKQAKDYDFFLSVLLLHCLVSWMRKNINFFLEKNNYSF